MHMHNIYMDVHDTAWHAQLYNASPQNSSTRSALSAIGHSTIIWRSVKGSQNQYYVSLGIL